MIIYKNKSFATLLRTYSSFFLFHGNSFILCISSLLLFSSAAISSSKLKTSNLLNYFETERVPNLNFIWDVCKGIGSTVLTSEVSIPSPSWICSLIFVFQPIGSKSLLKLLVSEFLEQLLYYDYFQLLQRYKLLLYLWK